MYLYYSRDTGISNFVTLKGKTKKVKKKVEEKRAKNNAHKNQEFCKKLNFLQHFSVIPPA